MRALALCLLLLYCLSHAYATDCPPCEEVACKELDCVGGMGEDFCGCCVVCLSQLGEQCGGDGLAGRLCDEGLICEGVEGREIGAFNSTCIEEVVGEPEPTTDVMPEPEPTDETYLTPGPEPITDIMPEPEPITDIMPEPEPTDETYLTPGPEPITDIMPEPEPTDSWTPGPEPITDIMPEPGNNSCEYPKTFSTCASACPTTCDTTGLVACTLQCVLRCVCPSDMVQRSLTNTTCVRREECPAPKCDFPMVLKECATSCPATCGDPDPWCTKECVLNQCVCSEGWVLQSLTNRTCVKRRDCEAPGTCPAPKIFEICATACPATCLLPNPKICTRNCNLDHCVCPEGYLMRSMGNRTCILPHECPDFSFCMEPCPPMGFGSSSCELSSTYACHLSNSVCSAYQWKVEVEKWWFENDCSELDYIYAERWLDTFRCREGVEIECLHDENRECSLDVFGCYSCKCAGGKYKSPGMLLELWKQQSEVHRLRLELYKEALQACRSLSSRC